MSLTRTDVLIVGGGLVGCATAYYLAREGVGVTVVERNDLNTAASGANAGSLHVQLPYEDFVAKGEEWARAFGPTQVLLRDSVAMWATLSDELGENLDVAQKGGLLVAETDAQMANLARMAAIQREQGIEIDLLGRDDLRALAPYITECAIGAAYCASEGKANPLRATPAFARAARGLGARILTHTTLDGLETDGSGYRATTSAGTIAAGRVVNAAGAEAASVAAMLGVDIPVEGWPLQVSVTEPLAPLVPHLVYSAAQRLTCKQMANGTCIIGGGWPSTRRADGRLAVNPHSLTGNMATAIGVVPALATARVVRTWPAAVNGTPNWQPIIGEAPGRPGFFIAAFPWMGFTAGPITARMTADLVLGR